MTTFDNREKAFEARFQHDQELQFKVMVRRNRMLGEWAGGMMGLEGEALAGYAKEVVESDFEKPGDSDVLQKVCDDLQAKGLSVSDHQVRKQMDDLLVEAKKLLMTQ